MQQKKKPGSLRKLKLYYVNVFIILGVYRRHIFVCLRTAITLKMV